MGDVWDQLALGADISKRQLDALREALPEHQAQMMLDQLDDNERRAALKLGLTAPLLAEFYGSKSDVEIMALIRSLQEAESGPAFTRNMVIRFTRSHKGHTPNDLFKHLTSGFLSPSYEGDIYTHPGCADLRDRSVQFFRSLAQDEQEGHHTAVARALTETLPILQSEFAERVRALNLAPITGTLPGAEQLFGQASESSS
jgi:hypothetical protein